MLILLLLLLKSAFRPASGRKKSSEENSAVCTEFPEKLLLLLQGQCSAGNFTPSHLLGTVALLPTSIPNINAITTTATITGVSPTRVLLVTVIVASLPLCTMYM